MPSTGSVSRLDATMRIVAAITGRVARSCFLRVARTRVELAQLLL
jgi:hypothetical protein